MNDPGALVKVRYVGQRAGAFGVTVGGVTRQWAAQPLGRHVTNARWLPKGEAEDYSKLPDFVVVPPAATAPPRRNVAEKKKKKVVKVQPKPPAVPVEEYVVGEQPQEAPRAPFVLSAAGVLHRRDCASCPKVPIAEFQSLAEAPEHSRFQRFHRSCIG